MDPLDDPSSADAERIAGLESTVQALERELARQRGLLDESQKESRAQTAEARRARHDYDALQARRMVRLALVVAAWTYPVAGAARRLVTAPRRGVRGVRRRLKDRARVRALRATPGRERAFIGSLSRSLPAATVTGGPLVSILISNDGGSVRLQACLDAVGATRYRDVEIVVVQQGPANRSAAGGVTSAARSAVRTVDARDAGSFAEAIGRGVAVATGEILCFLDDDAVPIGGDWLGHLVETLTTDGVSAVGARLVVPHRRDRASGGALPDLTLQHRGVDLELGGPIPVPRILGVGEDPLASAAGAVEDRPIVSAGCLAVDRGAFERVGGFSPEVGLEDVDLCLKLGAAGGRVVYDGRAVLWHTRPALRAGIDDADARPVDMGTFADRWAPYAFRVAFLDGVSNARRVSTTPLRVAVPPEREGTGPGPLSGLTTLGWATRPTTWPADQATAGEPPVDAAIVRDDGMDIRRLPRHVVTIALIEGEPDAWLARPWFDEFDVVLAPDGAAADRVRSGSAKVAAALPARPAGPGDDAATGRWTVEVATAIRDALAAWATATRFGLFVGVPDWEVAPAWGDYHFARAVQRALERSGHPTRVYLRTAWSMPVAIREDVSVHLVGLREPATHRSQVNVLWQISHPDRATPELYERYDQVFVASDPFAERMAPLVSVPVRPLHQATDPERFTPDPTGPHHELLFVANSRGVSRRIIDDLAGTTRDLAVYGSRWRPDLIDPRYVKGEGIPNGELGRYYSSASIVLNDHWDDMRANGFISNRLYDALACGAFVISDHIDGIEAEFDGAVVTYQDRSDLEHLIRMYLADPEGRHRLGERGRAAVTARHTFDARVRVLSDAVAAVPPKVPGVSRIPSRA